MPVCYQRTEQWTLSNNLVQLLINCTWSSNSIRLITIPLPFSIRQEDIGSTVCAISETDREPKECHHVYTHTRSHTNTHRVKLYFLTMLIILSLKWELETVKQLHIRITCSAGGVCSDTNKLIKVTIVLKSPCRAFLQTIKVMFTFIVAGDTLFIPEARELVKCLPHTPFGTTMF